MENLDPLLDKIFGKIDSGDAEAGADFGRFLVDYGVLSPESLGQLSSMTRRIGLPLQKVLTLSNFISEDVVTNLSRLYSITRAKPLPQNVTYQAVTLIHRDRLPVEQALAQAGIAGQIYGYSKIGVLLTEAKMITKDQLEDARKTSVETGLQLGRVLCFMGVISEEVLRTALSVQQQLRDRQINKDQALAELQKLKRDAPLPAQMAAPQPAAPELADKSRKTRVRLVDLLLLSGAVTELDVFDVFEDAFRTGRPVQDALAGSGLVPPELMQTCIDLQDSINSGNLDLNNIIDAIQYIGINPSKPIPSGAKTESEATIADLLWMARVIQKPDVERAATQLPAYPSIFGRLLVLTGTIDESTLIAAKQCQTMVRRGQIDMITAINALSYCVQAHMSFADALQEMGIEPPPG